jgi:hypothetical protein
VIYINKTAGMTEMGYNYKEMMRLLQADQYGYIHLVIEKAVRLNVKKALRNVGKLSGLLLN